MQTGPMGNDTLDQHFGFLRDLLNIVLPSFTESVLVLFVSWYVFHFQGQDIEDAIKLLGALKTPEHIKAR